MYQNVKFKSRSRCGRFASVSLLLALITPSLATPGWAERRQSGRTHRAAKPVWMGDEMPLPLAVRTPEDLRFKAEAERQYLIFNLFAGGKMAWDQGDFAQAAADWEGLLRLPGLDPDLKTLVDPLAKEARRRAGGQTPQAVTLPPPTLLPEPEDPAVASQEEENPGKASPVARNRFTVKGQVSGGGRRGVGGTVIWLHRKDGPTPRPKPMRNARMSQADKAFKPHILPVTQGTKVSFANQDPIFHNVFSLSKPNDFDSGMFKQGGVYQKVFSQPGAVQVLCNIHANMLGYIVVVDSPWYDQARRSGDFSIRNVPPGKYEVLAWNEQSSSVSKVDLEVGSGAEASVAVHVGNNAEAPNFVPDKYGKPRQRQLGY